MFVNVTTYFKKYDQLGAAELYVPDGAVNGWTLNGVPLTKTVTEYLIRYGLKQSLADSIASAKTLAEAEGFYDKRRNAMLNNTIEVRESGGIKFDDDPVMTLAIKTAKAGLLAIFDAMLLPNKAAKMIDYTQHEKIGKYFKVAKSDPTKAVWNDDSVMVYIAAQATKFAAGEKGAKDYLAEAAATLNVGVDFDI